MSKASGALAPATSGIGISGFLGLLFIALKLAHVIDWSWWWVLAPFWIPSAFAFFALTGILLVGLFFDRRN